MRLSPVICFLFVILGVAEFHSQKNLIVDPGFEMWTDSTWGANLRSLDYWYPVNGSPDHHIIYGEGDLSGIDTTCIPYSTAGGDCGKPFKGISTLGLHRQNGRTGNKEWAGTELIEPLDSGHCYRVGFHIRNLLERIRFDEFGNPDSSFFASNHWGVYFNDSSHVEFYPNIFDESLYLDHFVRTEEVVSGPEWQYFEFIYRADKDYTHAYFGYVGLLDTETAELRYTSELFGVYTWMDEVGVWDLRPQFFNGFEDSVVCLNDTIVLEVFSDTNYTISFEGEIVAENMPYSFVASEAGEYIFTATSVYSSDCIESSEFKIVVPQLVVESETYSVDTLECPLEGICHGVIKMEVSGGMKPYEFSWDDDSLYTDSLRTDLCNDDYCVRVSDASICPSDTTLCIALELRERAYTQVEIELPNICTPDGDGKNDVFKPGVWWKDGRVGPIEDYPLFLERIFDYHLVVVNRWGEVMFESKDPLEIWDLMDAEVKSGSYFYALKYYDSCFPDKLQTREGAVEILSN